MTAHRISRRLFVTTGAGVVGLAVVQTLTACSSSSSAPSAGRPASAPPSAAGGTGGWQRVDLGFVSAYLLLRGSEVAVVDTGTAGSGASIAAGLAAAGADWSAVKHLILTHHHPDHAGGLAEVEPRVKATVYAGAQDAATIVSDRALTSLADGDEVFGLQIIGTPGHTAGHVSIFDPSTGTLVAGDALRTENGLQGANPQYTADEKAAAASVKKLAGLDVKVILPGHGAPLTTGAKEALQKLAASG
ncbi:MBL fold metallo-hydrolase [Actinoplanes teichomyceticus]|uniref:Glyoxylase-like metal-dependent hydrolase (Beta-lactamase superfamily II) n=1 Tax=Actinoplanes teichomyceticus TaxID=1867 RepID=A0A561WJY9_ACTTI|nr:MBL fold metallo-hydrolase [Actinoplanes teichomyceticus]TWG24158.1 glyoxylase-like metal-dependent hydrolase (beta-lactamase superfamily II) [Actinoplanes teichomyceticus]GIF12998.1 hypothetical protein Ate01nite_30300 [Actinoplanes teichomyceticus]